MTIEEVAYHIPKKWLIWYVDDPRRARFYFSGVEQKKARLLVAFPFTWEGYDLIASKLNVCGIPIIRIMIPDTREILRIIPNEKEMGR